jgi:hypothetical protein
VGFDIQVIRKNDKSGHDWAGSGLLQEGCMNAGLLGRMFGGAVAEVMGGPVATEQQKFIAFTNQ